MSTQSFVSESKYWKIALQVGEHLQTIRAKVLDQLGNQLRPGPLWNVWFLESWKRS